MAKSLPRPMQFRVLVILVAMIAIVIAGWYALNATPRLDEANRVRHPSGFSIIPPRDWDFYFSTAEEGQDYGAGISLRPRSFKGQSPSIAVSRIVKMPTTRQLEEIEFKSTTFQGQSAFVADKRIKWTRRLRVICQRDKDWFELSVSLPQGEMFKIDDYWPVLNSFQITPPIRSSLLTTGLAPLLPQTPATNASN